MLRLRTIAAAGRLLDRREFFAVVGGTTWAAAVPAGIAAAESLPPERPTLGFSTYGLPGMKSEEAVPLLADIGFDSVELDARAEGDAEPTKLSAARRDAIRGRLADSGLRLTALMVERHLAGDDAGHALVLDALRAAADLGHALSPDRPPLIQTTLGGGRWEEARTWYRDRLADWVRVADATDTTIAIKPHRGGAMSQPAEAAWLIEQLGRPARLRMVYDYSHYAFRSLALEDTVRTALPITAHVALKDAAREGDNIVFDLPGSRGTIDYVRLFRLFVDGGYRGDLCCEVSGQVWRRPGYDGPAAARICHANMRAALARL
jgi:sugar phosphate isomerase/epimerase